MVSTTGTGGQGNGEDGLNVPLSLGERKYLLGNQQNLFLESKPAAQPLSILRATFVIKMLSTQGKINLSKHAVHFMASRLHSLECCTYNRVRSL